MAVSREWSMLLRWIFLLGLAAGSWSGSLSDNQFNTLSYDTIVTQLHELAANYPHLAQVQLRLGVSSFIVAFNSRRSSLE